MNGIELGEGTQPKIGTRYRKNYDEIVDSTRCVTKFGQH